MTIGSHVIWGISVHQANFHDRTSQIGANLTEARNKVGTLTRPTAGGYSAPTILALLCLLGFTACSAPQSTSSTWQHPSGQNWTSSVATRGAAIEATEVSGEQVAAAAENGNDPLGTAWAPKSTAASPFLARPAKRAKAPTFDSHILDRIQLADASATPVTATAQENNKAGDTAPEGAAEPKLQIAAAQSDDVDLAELAQKTNNPIGEAWLLITQNDTTLLKGDAIDGEEILNVTKFMPVLSAPILGGDWNLVVRPVLQFSSVPVNDNVGNLFGVSPNDIVADPSLSAIAADPFGRTNGLGDTVLLTLAGPNADDGWIFAGGVSQIFPTASEEFWAKASGRPAPLRWLFASEMTTAASGSSTSMRASSLSNGGPMQGMTTGVARTRPTSSIS